MSRVLETSNISGGLGGINRAKNLGVVASSDLAYADGITIERDILEKEAGASRFNSVATTGAIKKTWDFKSNSGVQELVAYVDTGAASSIVTLGSGGVVKTLASGLTTGGTPIFSEGWDNTLSLKALYLADGKNGLRLYTGGATMDLLTNISVDWSGTNQPSIVEGHDRTRMAACGNANFPHNIYLTTPGDHSDYIGSESHLISCYPGEGEKIASIISFQSVLYVIKYPCGIYYLDDSSVDIADWTIIKVTDAIGTTAHGCCVVIENDILILGADGIFYSLSQITQTKQTSVPPLLPREFADFMRDNINLSQLSLTQSVWYGNKRQAIFAVPATGATQSNRRIILDLHEVGKVKALYSSRDVCTALGMRRATATDISKPIIGDAAGFVYSLDQASRNKNSAAYTGQYETQPIALYSNGLKRGNLAELEITFQPQGNWDLTVEVQRDGIVSQTLAFSMNTPGAAVGSISLDADVLAGNIVANTKHRLIGDARYVKLIGKNSAANQNFAVMNHAVRFSEGNTR